MSRRDKAGGKAKTQRRRALKRRNAPKATLRRSSYAAGKETNVGRLTRELQEAREQQTATSEVLSIIRRSPADAQPVFDAIVQSAARLCDAIFSVVYLYDRDRLRIAATQNFTPEATSKLQQRQELKRPDRSHVGGRAILDRAIVHVHDVLADPEYSRELALAGGWRAVLAVPLLRDGIPVGALTVGKTEPMPFSDRQIQLLNTFADQALIAIENVRLFETEQQRTRQLSESLEQQTATSEVLKVISSSPGELEPVFEAMLENAVRICSAKFGILYLSEGDVFRIGALHGVPPAYAEVRRREPIIHLRPGTAITRASASKQPVQIADVRAEAAYHSGDPSRADFLNLTGARTVVVVPMLKDDQVVGVISIYRQEVRPFTDKQIELVKNFAAQAVIAIENTRLLNELRQRTDDLSESLEQQTATSEVLKVISSSPGELGPVFNAMIANATRLCGAEVGTFALYDGSGFRGAAVYGHSERFADVLSRVPPRTHRETGLGRLEQTRQTVQVAEVAAEVAYEEIRRLNPDFGRIRTALYVPIVKERDLIGAFMIYRHQVRPFTDKQVALVENFAAQAVIAIENTRLLSELRESLQQQTATADVLKVISRSTFDLQTVLDALLQSAARLCRADRAAMRLSRDGAYHTVAIHGFSPQHVEYMKSHPIAADRSSIAGRAVLEGKAVHIADIQSDPELTLPRAAPGLANVRTLLGVPMLREGAPVGVLVLSRERVQPFSDKQIELVSTFADQAVIAIENVRLFESVEARTRELAKSLEDLRTTQDRLVQTQKLASLGQLTAGIAHEIKNPLNFVNNFSGVSAELIDELQEALKDASLNEKRRSEITELMATLRGNLEKVVQHGKRADAIVKNMLLHSREGAGEHRVVDINAIVEESLNLAYHGARAEKQGFNITLERSLDPTAGEVDVFPQDITRVLLNLISNGFYAATKRRAETNGGDYEPTLAATTKNLGDRVEITIRDNGTGIPPDVKEKMFNPFFTTKPAGEGTGLGLSISHDIVVKQHGGSIEVDTQPGEFTEFRIILPRAAVFHAESGGRV